MSNINDVKQRIMNENLIFLVLFRYFFLYNFNILTNPLILCHKKILSEYSLQKTESYVLLIHMFIS